MFGCFHVHPIFLPSHSPRLIRRISYFRALTRPYTHGHLTQLLLSETTILQQLIKPHTYSMKQITSRPHLFKKQINTLSFSPFPPTPFSSFPSSPPSSLPPSLPRFHASPISTHVPIVHKPVVPGITNYVSPSSRPGGRGRRLIRGVSRDCNVRIGGDGGVVGVGGRGRGRTPAFWRG